MCKFIAILIIAILISGCNNESVIDEIYNDESVEVDEVTTISSVTNENMVIDEGGKDISDLEEIDNGANPSDSDDECIYIIIIADILNVREQPSIDSDKLANVYQRKMYEVIDIRKDENADEWYLIEFDIGENGWIASWFTELIDSEEYYERATALDNIHESTDVIMSIMDLSRRDVLELIGEEDRALWDNIEMEELYHIYDDYGFAIVYEMNEEYEVTDDSEISFIDVRETCKINGINKYMSGYEVESILGDSEHIDYDWWHHDIDEPFHRTKLEYSFAGYDMNVYVDFESGFIFEINILPKIDDSNYIDESLVSELFGSSRKHILDTYEYESLTYGDYYSIYSSGNTEEVVISEWFKLVEYDIYIGFIDQEVYVIKLYNDYLLEHIKYGESLDSIAMKLDIFKKEKKPYDYDSYYYYITHDSKKLSYYVGFIFLSKSR